MPDRREGARSFNVRMSILNDMAQKPGPLERIAEAITLRRLILVSGIIFGITSVCLATLLIVGLVFFTANDSEVAWLFPLTSWVAGFWMVSAPIFAISGVVAVVQATRRDT
ncbi:MAG TPA: hypothetical protein VD837_17155 [Terriglobales bacterium]|nr:hypothetical protein [Terriglobales bacterium]